jgi:predicted dehydrogenase
MFSSLDAALEQVEADTCFVCTPPSAHASVVSAAFDAELDCFVEKPLTIDPELSEGLARQADDRGRRGVVGYVRRFAPTLRRLRDEALERGGARHVSASLLSPQFVGRAGQGAARGGVDWDLLVHATDAALFLGGSGAGEVRHVRRRGSEAVAVEGRFGDLDVSLEADWARADVRKVEMRCELVTEKGGGLGCDEDTVWSVGEDKSRHTIFHRRDAPPPWFDVAGVEFSEEVKDLLDCFSSGRPSAGTSLREAAAVDRFVVAVIGTEPGPWEAG